MPPSAAGAIASGEAAAAAVASNMTGAAMSKRMRPEYYGKITGRREGRSVR